MEDLKQLLAAGQLSEAITQTQQTLRQSPGETALRASLIELLCLAGDIERADEVIATLMKRHPDWLPGAVNLRQLIRAQQTRLALQQGQLGEDVKVEPSAALEALLKLHLHRHEGDLEAAAQAAAALEAERQPSHFKAGDQQGEIRDCDDSLGPYLEALGTDGYYYLWQWHELAAIELHTPQSPIELTWRRANITLTSGSQGEVFIPLTYVGSQNDAQRLGRETDWQELTPELVVGLGQKLLVLGNEALPFANIRYLERVEDSAADAE